MDSLIIIIYSYNEGSKMMPYSLGHETIEITAYRTGSPLEPILLSTVERFLILRLIFEAARQGKCGPIGMERQRQRDFVGFHNDRVNCNVHSMLADKTRAPQSRSNICRDLNTSSLPTALKARSTWGNGRPARKFPPKRNCRFIFQLAGIRCGKPLACWSMKGIL